MQCSVTSTCRNEAGYWTDVDGVVYLACPVCTEGMMAFGVEAEQFTALGRRSGT